MNLSDIYKYTFLEEPSNTFCEKLPKFLYPYYLKRVYKFRTGGKKLNLNNPKTISEKIQWLKLYSQTPDKTRLTDKLLVRDYIKEKIGEKYLKNVLGIWNHFDEINFDVLPELFVLKVNHSCRANVGIRKSMLTQDEKNEHRTFFENKLKENFAFVAGFELQYINIKPKLFAEEYISNIQSYEVFCINGNPKFFNIRYWSKKGVHSTYFDKDLNPLEFNMQNPYDFINFAEVNINAAEEILECSKILSEKFDFVRCDFILDNQKKVLFEEMTFTPNSGFVPFIPEKYEYILGEMIQLKKSKSNF